jgi:hypothetical protein
MRNVNDKVAFSVPYRFIFKRSLLQGKCCKACNDDEDCNFWVPHLTPHNSQLTPRALRVLFFTLWKSCSSQVVVQVFASKPEPDG